MYSRCFHWFPGPLTPSVSKEGNRAPWQCHDGLPELLGGVNCWELSNLGPPFGAEIGGPDC